MKHNLQELILKNCPRLFSAIDQNEFSVNFGCFNRDFWHYKIEKDFPSSIFQTGVWPMAMLYKNNFTGNLYFQKQKTLNLILAGLDFWCRIQGKNGSFVEWFPGETSHVATAFTTFAVSETVLLLGQEVPKPLKRKVLKSLVKAGRWLSKNPDLKVLNHTVGALVALHNLYLLTRKKEFQTASLKHLNLLLSVQTEEGWFPEYGGADLGYQSLSVFFLAKYWQKTNDLRAFKALEKAINFMSYFIHPDGSYGGEYGSRGTKFLMPAGLQIMVGYLPQAEIILSRWVPFDSCDDRYLIFFFLGNWLEGFLLKKKIKKERWIRGNFSKNFSEAGIRVEKTKNLYFVFAYKKNGVLKVFKNKKLVFSDTGWWGRLKDGRTITSQWFNQNQDLEIKTRFCYFQEPLLGPKIIFFRLFNWTLGKNSFFSSLFADWVKRNRIMKAKTLPVFLARRLVRKNDKIFLEDEIVLGKNIFLSSLKTSQNLSQRFTPTGAFFHPSDLLGEESLDLAVEANRKRKIQISQRVI